VKPSLKSVRRILYSVLSLFLLGGIGAVSSADAQTIQVTSANPNSTAQGTVSLNVQINGQGFKKGATSKWFVTGTTNPGGVTVNSTAFINSQQLTANITVAQDATISNFDIHVTNTNGRTGKGTELFAVIAPDPAIGFTSIDSSSLMVMNADGTSQRALLQGPTGVTYRRPSWSPDGSQLVFESTIQGDGIYVINKDGSGLRKVVALNNGAGLADPVWSPFPAADGQFKIAFSDQPSGQLQNNLFLVNLDGTGLANLTNSIESQFYPTWDPYAARLAAQVYPCPPNTSCTARLYEYSVGLVSGAVAFTSTTDLAASGPLQSWDIYEPDWAKTQDKIVLSARPLSNINDSALWIVSLSDLANPDELTATFDTLAVWPSWSPDDSKIVYRRKVSAKVTISVMNADGSAVVDLANGDQPGWRRCCPTCLISCAR